MKKMLAIILILCLLPIISLADVDLSSMSIDELQSLRKNICSEILSRSKWNSVTVPSGFYVVGEDIPAGHWTIRYSDPWSIVTYFSKTDETGKSPDYWGGVCYSANIGAPGNELESLYNLKEIDLDLKPGYYLTVEMGSVIFEPFTGRTSPFYN